MSLTPEAEGASWEQCPLCGMDVAIGKAEQILRDMDFDNRSCAGCAFTFGERRREFVRARAPSPPI